MPVIAEIVSKPSDQDLIDLEKTYEGQTQWLQNAIAGSDLVIGGRFNDRLVAACVLTDEGDHWQLEKLQVRAITRRRGVARQTLNSMLKKLAITRPVQVDLTDNSELTALFTELGFSRHTAHQDKTIYQWQP